MNVRFLSLFLDFLASRDSSGREDTMELFYSQFHCNGAVDDRMLGLIVEKRSSEHPDALKPVEINQKVLESSDNQVVNQTQCKMQPSIGAIKEDDKLGVIVVKEEEKNANKSNVEASLLVFPEDKEEKPGEDGGSPSNESNSALDEEGGESFKLKLVNLSELRRGRRRSVSQEEQNHQFPPGRSQKNHPKCTLDVGLRGRGKGQSMTVLEHSNGVKITESNREVKIYIENKPSSNSSLTGIQINTIHRTTKKRESAYSPKSPKK